MLHLQVKPLSLRENVIYLQQDIIFLFSSSTYTRNHSRQYPCKQLQQLNVLTHVLNYVSFINKLDGEMDN